MPRRPKVQGSRPIEVRCNACPTVIRVAAKGKIPVRCVPCRRAEGARKLLAIAADVVSPESSEALGLAHGAKAAGERIIYRRKRMGLP